MTAGLCHMTDRSLIMFTVGGEHEYNGFLAGPVPALIWATTAG